MKARILLRSRAEERIAEYAAYIRQDSPEAAERFLQAVEQQTEFLSDFPRIGTPAPFSLSSPEYRGIRCAAVSKTFGKYLLFYREVETGIEIITVEHTSQDLEPILEDVVSRN